MLTIRPHFSARIAGDHGLRAQEGGFEIDRDGLVEVALGEIGDSAYGRKARIVDEDVDRPERRGDAIRPCR